MKDEEMAEEYLQGIEGDDCVIITDREERKQAFLAGLKAGRPQWHDLEKDPTDLPEKYIPVQNQDGEHRSYDGHYWRDCDDVIYTNVIAWCEIPTFDKE